MTFLLYVLIGLLALLLSWLEWQRSDRRRRVPRVVAVLLAAAALALLAARPSYRVTVNPQVAVLLTSGTPADSLRALLAALPKETSMWTTDSSLAGTRVQWVPSPGDIPRRQPGLRTVHLLGHGLPGHQLPPLDSVRVVPHLTPPAAGLVAAHWTEQVALGDSLVVQGEYRNVSNGTVQLRLAGFGKGLDSVTVAPGATARFSLRATPKETGPFVFHLESRAGTRRLGGEKIPFEVTPKRLLNVLFLESFPTFGGKFLKAFLSEEGHRVVARAAISKGKFRTEFLNAPATALGRLTPTLLGGLDLIILDDASLRNLSGPERVLLRSAIHEGLGVLVWASEGKLPGQAPFNAFRLAPAPGPEERRLALRWMGRPAAPPLTFPPLFVENTPAVRPLVKAGKDGALAAFAPFGLGGVTVAVAGNAFEWVLAGRAPVHASYWSHLLTATARRREAFEHWQIATPLPVPDVPVTLQLVSANPQLPVLSVDSTALYPQQATAGLGSWESTFWPRREGWHAATMTGGAPFRWYVFGNNDWPGLQARHRYNATLEYLAEQNQAGSVASSVAPVSRREAVPPVWFYGMFLLSMGYLWVERKM